LSEFSSACDQNGFTLINMAQSFLQTYDKDHVLPYGFINTAVGTGHLNKYGHRMIAQELLSAITLLESGDGE
jgi:hypothetical protein